MNRSALFPQPAERRVGRLKLRVEAEEDARRAAILLSDSLQTASMPVVGEKDLLVVRRLSLGRISLRSSSATLALQMQEALREVAATAVPFGHPAARDANAVFFRSRGEAIVALARQNARPFATAEWFWPSIAPGWCAQPSPGKRWLLLLEAAHQLPEAALVSAMVLEAAAGAQAEDSLLTAVPPDRAAAWLKIAGWHAPLGGWLLTAPNLLPAHTELVRRWRDRWGFNDERVIWLATMFAVLERPSRSADPLLPERMAAWLRSIPERGGLTASLNATPADASTDTLLATRPADLALQNKLAPSRERTALPPHEGDQPEVASSRVQQAAVEPSGSEVHQPAPDRARTPVGEQSEFAGLCFLLPVLEALTFPEFLERNPALIDCNFPAALLCLIGMRVGLRPDDPLVLALTGCTGRSVAPPGPQLPSAARELLVHPKPRGRMDSLELVWVTALRRYCRRRARIGLASLIRRPGFVAASRTHLDVFFDLAAADVRVRRSGLDIDPGWVPWLGRVVRFHYLHPDELAG
jgi:hypothetical protein